MYKINKKAILGFAMSIVFSLAIMQGISQKNVQQQDMNLQQVGAGVMVLGGMEGGASGTAIQFGGATMLNFVAQSSPVWTTMGPVGWVLGGGMAL